MTKQKEQDPEKIEFPRIPDDQVWCELRGQHVQVNVCVNSCVAPEQRPVCWLGKMYHDEPMEGGSG